jgi:penicillin-binding protein 1A
MAYEVVTPTTAYLMTSMLQKVTSPGGTGAAARQAGLKAPIGGKTGTTDNYEDAWFIGFNPGYTCGVWVGLDDPEKIIGQGYGGKLALPIWADVMRAVEAKEPTLAKTKFPQLDLLPAVVCAESGGLANANCPHPQRVNLPQNKMPSTTCTQHQAAGPPPTAPAKNEEQRTLWDHLKGIFR